MESDEDDDEHLEEIQDDSLTRSDSSQNLSQGNRKETRLTPGRCRYMSK